MIYWFRFSEGAQAPFRKHFNDAGFDLSLDANSPIEIAPHSRKTLPTGVGFIIPDGMYGQVLDRSSMGEKGLIVAGGVIDAGYRGEVRVMLWNVSSETVILTPSQRIAQIVFMPCHTQPVKEIAPEQRGETLRGSNGFGSTGK